MIEHPSVRAIDLGGVQDPPAEMAFLDGVQRYGVIGWIGILPIVRGSVAAAVMERRSGALSCSLFRQDDFLVAALGRLDAVTVSALESVGLPLHDCTDGDRSHPILDVQMAGRQVERRREGLEVALAQEWLSNENGGWLVVDGSITALPKLEMHPSILGVIKSHETQFLEGADLVTALTLPSGHRTSVFSRESGARSQVYTWYLRLWPWEDRDVLHGLVRLERAPTATALREATDISRWLLRERAPLSAPDGRWDRLLYPVHQVEAYLRSQMGDRL